MPRVADSAWQHFDEVGRYTEGSGVKKVICKFCKLHFSATLQRARSHLLGGGGHGVRPCPDCPDKVRDAIKAEELARNHDDANRREAKKACRRGQAMSVAVPKEETGAIVPLLTGPKKVSMLEVWNPERPIREVSAPTQEDLDRKISRWFYANGLHFDAASSPYFAEMLAAIAALGNPNYRPPSPEKICKDYLQEEVTRILLERKAAAESWAKWGCTVVSFGWTDVERSPLVNVMVSGSQGTTFCKAIDTMGEHKSSEFVAAKIKKVIRKVGSENVVQLITDLSDSCTRAGADVHQEFPSIFWTPCTAQCLNLLLEDISKLEWVHQILQRALQIAQFFTTYGSFQLALFRKYSKLDSLLRPGHPSQYARDFITLRTLAEVKNPLRQTVVSDEWVAWPDAKVGTGKEVELTLLGTELWEQVELVLRISTPLVELLHMIDADVQKCMIGKVYKYMESAIEKIVNSLRVANGLHDWKVAEIRELCKVRWGQLHASLHAAAYFLDPEYQGIIDYEMEAGDLANGWDLVLDKMIGSKDGELRKAKDQLKDQLKYYHQKMGSFGGEDAQWNRSKIPPHRWWEEYGAGTPELTDLALRILGQPTSASPCERNWKSYDYILSKKRSRPKDKVTKDLVLVHSNLRLRSRMDVNHQRAEYATWDAIPDPKPLAFCLDAMDARQVHESPSVALLGS